METFRLSDGSQISYKIKGNGRPLLFLHGLGAESSMFQPQVDYFSKKYQVIVPDLRGNGKSDKLECKPEEVLNLQAKDILELLAHLGVSKVVISGVSYGGVMTIHLMTYYPEIFEAAILDDTFCTTETSPFLNALVKLTLPLSSSKWFMQMSTRPIYKRWPKAAEYFNKLFSDFRGAEAILQRKAIMKLDYQKSLKGISIPVLCMAGDYSNKLVDMMETIVACLANERHFVIKNSFDPSNLCQADIYNAHIENFLKEVLGW
ncbi:alpha/beta fold hydrolase [Vaginisenegalia massiliensis]|uniref:alpha/beta fold hydrolase n=1 Tax=Vaginisenegalia massiliensis TaxID=2058294 RepID=UPI000F52D0BF|nr:alpha/beta hydrolase [Vaginisenegalia massiliensis]